MAKKNKHTHYTKTTIGWFPRLIFRLYGGRYNFLSRCFEDWEKQSILMALQEDEKFYYTKMDRDCNPYYNPTTKSDLRKIFAKRGLWQ